MIYISGKITGSDDYIERFAAAEKFLTDSGYTVVNPAKVNAQLPKETPYSGYINVSLAMLSMCDQIFMLNGWEDSKGAKLEYEYAQTHELEVLYEKVGITEIKLKPCPFCGGVAKLENLGYPHHVYCTSCSARITGIGFGEDGEKDSIQKWNRRYRENMEGE